MTKEAALYQFFNSFGIPGYKSTNVPEDAVFPWLTYEEITGNYENTTCSLTVNVWYYTDNDSLVNEKIREIEDAIDYNGTPVQYDGGFMMIDRGDPWCQSEQDEVDSNINRRRLIVNVTYYSL